MGVSKGFVPQNSSFVHNSDFPHHHDFGLMQNHSYFGAWLSSLLLRNCWGTRCSQNSKLAPLYPSTIFGSHSHKKIKQTQNLDSLHPTSIPSLAAFVDDEDDAGLASILESALEVDEVDESLMRYIKSKFQKLAEQNSSGSSSSAVPAAAAGNAPPPPSAQFSEEEEKLKIVGEVLGCDMDFSRWIVLRNEFKGSPSDVIISSALDRLPRLRSEYDAVVERRRRKELDDRLRRAEVERNAGKENSSMIDEVTKKLIMSRFDDESYAVGSNNNNNNNNNNAKAKKEARRNSKKEKSKSDSGVRFRDGVVVSNKGGKFITEEVRIKRIRHEICSGKEEGSERRVERGCFKDVNVLPLSPSHLFNPPVHLPLTPPQIKPDWDGGSRGRVKSKGKRGVGWT